MRASRLLSILITLQTRGRVTAAALADQFEVSVRTIYRDVDALSAAGVPVYADRGPGGGFALLDGYRTRLTGFTAAEAEALLLMGLPGPASDLGLGESVSTARLKLLAALPAAAVGGAEKVADRFHLDPVDWYRRAAAPLMLGEVAAAVWAQRRIRIRYEGWNAEVTRMVEPLGLVLKGGRWYLVARGDGATRTYRVSQIRELEAGGEEFERPAGFDLATHWGTEVERFEQSLRRGTARLRVRPGALSLIDRLGADAAEAILAAPPDGEGCREATIPIEGVRHAASLLLGLRDLVEVLEPAELRDEIRNSALRLAALYDPAAGAA